MACQTHSQTVVYERPPDRPATARCSATPASQRATNRITPCKPKHSEGPVVAALFEETASGGRWDRPELHRVLDHLREGDTVVVWKLDRLSRSLKDVLHIMERIGNAGAGFRSITENIDTPLRPDE